MTATDDLRISESEALLRGALDATDNAILVVGVNGRILFANRRFLELWQTPAEVLQTGDGKALLDGIVQRLAIPDGSSEQETDPQESANAEKTRWRILRLQDGRTFEHYTRLLRWPGQTARLWSFRDVTAERRMRSDLEQERGLLKTLFRTVPDLIWLKDPNGIYLACNPTFERFFGACEANIVGKTDYDFVDRELAEFFRANDRAAIAAGDSRSNEERLNFADGREGIFETVKTPAYASDGRLLGVLGVARDITERKRVEAALRESEEKFRAMADAAQDAIVMLDREGNVSFWNRAAETVFGYAADEILGHNVHKLLAPPEFASRHEAAFALFRADGQGAAIGQTLELPALRKDGQTIPIELSLSAVKMGDDWRAIGIARDIAARKRAEAELERHRHGLEERVIERTAELAAKTAQLAETEERLRYAMEATSDGLWDWRLDTGVTYCNAAYFRMLGHDPADFADDVSSRWLGLLHPEDREAAHAALLRNVAALGHYEMEFRMRARDGSYRWILSRGRVVERDAAGMPLRVVGTHIDITERKRRETELAEAKRRAETADRAKSAFLANMSHEIRTPLNAIVGFAHLLNRELSDPAHAAPARKISEAASRLLGIVEDILDISQLETGKLSLEYAEFDLGFLLTRALNAIAAKARERGLELAYDPASTPGGRFVGDACRLGQILSNFLDNAAKFTPKGKISLRAKTLEETADAHWIRFEVADTGIGIAPADRSRLFEAFAQIDDSSTRKYDGAGLGLAVSRRLAQLMGGRVGMESRPGEGSTFWLEAPLRRADDEATKREAARGARLLLAEDNRVNREMMRQILGDMGFAVDFAENGAEAVAMAAKHAYDLILMDMQMPIMDGLEATRALRRIAGGCAAPILAMTASDLEDDRRRCLEAGMDDYLVKSVAPAKLFDILTKWLGQTPRRLVAPAPVRPDPNEAETARLAERLPGVDIGLGLRRVNGNRENYLKLLHMYAEGHAEDLAKLSRALAAGHAEEALRLAHSLKSVSGTVGAVGVQTWAAELETAIREGQPPDKIEALSASAEATLKPIADAILNLPAAPGRAASERADWPRIAQAATRLDALLADDDIRAGQAFRDMESLLAPLLGERAEAFGRAMNGFEYDRALAALRSACAEKSELLGIRR